MKYWMSNYIHDPRTYEETSKINVDTDQISAYLYDNVFVKDNLCHTHTLASKPPLAPIGRGG